MKRPFLSTGLNQCSLGAQEGHRAPQKCHRNLFMIKIKMLYSRLSLTQAPKDTPNVLIMYELALFVTK